MNADNWAICPRCLSRSTADREARERKVFDLYGAVSVEEFDAARSALKSVDPESVRTFRENCQFYGAVDGEVQVSYRGSCKECGLVVKLKTSKRFLST